MAEQQEQAVQRLLDVLTPLLDPDWCSPFASAWELDPYSNVTLPDGTRLDGESLHVALVQAVVAVRDSQTPQP